MEDLKISCIQTDLLWMDIQGNLEQLSNKINSITENTDIIILPEMFTTGFIMEPEVFADKMDGESVQWMKKMAEKKEAVITGSLVIRENNQFFNRLIVAYPNGKFEFYDKRHLFAMGGENKHYQQGTRKLIFNYKGWRIQPMICYDLRFPVWSRFNDDYEVLIYLANWPAIRSFHWKVLLQARAIENQAYTIGVNRIGNDGNNIYHSGDTSVYDPIGIKISTINPDEDRIETITLESAKIQKIRKSLPFGLDRDKFTIH